MDIPKIILLLSIGFTSYLAFSYYYMNHVVKESFIIGGNQPLNPLWWIKVGNTAINRTLKAGCWVNDTIGKGIKRLDLMY